MKARRLTEQHIYYIAPWDSATAPLTVVNLNAIRGEFICHRWHATPADNRLICLMG